MDSLTMASGVASIVTVSTASHRPSLAPSIGPGGSQKGGQKKKTSRRVRVDTNANVCATTTPTPCNSSSGPRSGGGRKSLGVALGAAPSAANTIASIATSHGLSVLDNIHRCPVCKQGLCDNDGLSLKENYLKYKRDAEKLRKRLEDKWDGRSSRRSEDEAVVVATCGELFHKRCLLNYCSSSFSGSKYRTAKSLIRKPIECPRCNKPIMYSFHQDVDVEGHRLKAGGPTLFDKTFNDVRLKNQEMLFHCDKEAKRLQKLDDLLTAAKGKLSVLRKKKNELDAALPTSKVMVRNVIEKMKRRRAEKMWIENYIDKAQKVIEFMQKETSNTMRLYLMEVQSKPLDEIPKRTPIPRMLIPYLHEISNDDYCLFALSQIVEPRPYPGIKFQLDDLLLGVLRNVNAVLGQQLIARSKKSGSSIIRAYDEMFPGTCLKVLQSCRNLQNLDQSKINGNTHRITTPVKDSKGNDLEITIMYMIDEGEEELLEITPQAQKLKEIEMIEVQLEE